MSKKKTRLICVSEWGNNKVFGDMFDSVYQHGNGRNVFSLQLGPEDTIVLEGGTDINPNFYGQRPGSWTQRPDLQRDAMERILIRRGTEANANFLGICRGAQFLTAIAGGELVQHVSHHTGGNHVMVTKDQGNILTNSFHHQMMFPFGLPKEEYEILAHVPTPLSDQYLIEGDEDVKDFLPEGFVEPEVVWYPMIKALAIQGHPEFVVRDSRSSFHGPGPLSDFVAYSRKLVKEFILNDIPV